MSGHLNEEIKPGWNNGVVELLDPVERGWRLLGREVVSNVVDLNYIRSIKSLPDNPYCEEANG